MAAQRKAVAASGRREFGEDWLAAFLVTLGRSYGRVGRTTDGIRALRKACDLSANEPDARTRASRTFSIMQAPTRCSPNCTPPPDSPNYHSGAATRSIESIGELIQGQMELRCHIP